MMYRPWMYPFIKLAVLVFSLDIWKLRIEKWILLAKIRKTVIETEWVKAQSAYYQRKLDRLNKDK